MRPPRSARLLPLALAASLLPGCVLADLPDRPRHALPVVEVERPTPAAPTAWDVLWPFGRGEHGAGERSRGVRPLFRLVSTDRAERIEVLYPLFRDTREDAARSMVLFPFLWHDVLEGPDGRDVDTAVVPFLWWGREPGRGGWFLFFPLGGTVREKFLLDEGTFVLFPAYLRSRNGEYRGHHVLWPLVHAGSGGGRRAFRVLPFWSAADADGRYHRRALLWPFLHWGVEDAGGDDPRDRWLVWPLLGREVSRSGASRAWTALWPLFQWADGPRSTARDLPFPFFRTRETRADDGSVESSLLWFWPAWGRTDGPVSRSGFLLWPLGMWWEEASGGRRTAGTHANPFWLRVERGPVGGPPDEVAWRLWPLVSGVRRGDGASSWSALAPIPFVRWPEFEASWGVFWELVRHRRDADGSTATDLLFSLVRHRSGPAGSRFRVPGLFSMETAAGGGTSWRFLEGLAGVDRDGPGPAHLRFLWFLRLPVGGGEAP